jgi:Trk-type K+ transport system membrane component
MLRGRHRGLPVAIDKAVLLPREEQNDAEEDDELIRMERSVSRGRSV